MIARGCGRRASRSKARAIGDGARPAGRGLRPTPEAPSDRSRSPFNALPMDQPASGRDQEGRRRPDWSVLRGSGPAHERALCGTTLVTLLCTAALTVERTPQRPTEAGLSPVVGSDRLMVCRACAMIRCRIAQRPVADRCLSGSRWTPEPEQPGWSRRGERCHHARPSASDPRHRVVEAIAASASSQVQRGTPA